MPVADEEKWFDTVVEDNHRRIRHALEPGDIIEQVQNVNRIVGVDSFRTFSTLESMTTFNSYPASLLVLGKTCLYIFSGFVELDDGELIDARDAPPDLFILPTSLLPTSSVQEPLRWYVQSMTPFRLD